MTDQEPVTDVDNPGGLAERMRQAHHRLIEMALRCHRRADPWHNGVTERRPITAGPVTEQGKGKEHANPA